MVGSALLKSRLLKKIIIFFQLVSPGAWLSDLCIERYEVREKKTSRKVLFKHYFHLFLFPSMHIIRSQGFIVQLK